MTLSTVASVRSVAGGASAEEPRNIERIRSAALQSFAVHGTSETTLRGVAAAAGVSLGLVQHHFATKAGLIKAVDDYVLDVVIAPISQPISGPGADTVAEIGGRVTRILTDHPEVAAYASRALVDGSQLGVRLFDSLYAAGTVRWHQRAERGETRPGIDVTWAIINSLVLALGAISLRAHIDRQLPESFGSPGQLERWQTAVNSLLREGLMRPPGND